MKKSNSWSNATQNYYKLYTEMTKEWTEWDLKFVRKVIVSYNFDHFVSIFEQSLLSSNSSYRTGTHQLCIARHSRVARGLCWVKKILNQHPSSIRCPGSNSQPLDHEVYALTTRPLLHLFNLSFHRGFKWLKSDCWKKKFLKSSLKLNLFHFWELI